MFFVPITIFATLLLGSILTIPIKAERTFYNASVFVPPSDWPLPRTIYARSLLIEHDGNEENVMLATWENDSPEPPLRYFPIFKSADGGMTWKEISRVTDQVNGWGLSAQPFLYELPEDLGSFKAGTILCSGNSIPDNGSHTQIDLYASKDQGVTWSFVSHIASGGPAIATNGYTPVWEPFLMLWNGQMIAYYSDQRDPLHGQKLAHQVSSDLLTWEASVNDVAYDDYDYRPGMTTVTRMGNGSFIMTYEFYGAPEAEYAVYYRIADDPTKFDSSEGQVLRATDGTVPSSSPYITWSAVGGGSGVVIVSANGDSAVFLNKCLGAPNAWTRVSTLASAAYARSLRVLPGEKDLLIVSGGAYQGTNNSVTASVIDLTALLPELAACD